MDGSDVAWSRDQIMAAAILILVNAATSAGARVYDSPAFPTQSGQTPALLLYFLTDDQVAISAAGGAPSYDTTLTLVVHGKVEVKDPTTLGATLRDLMTAARMALLGSASFVANFSAIPRVTTLYGDGSPQQLILGEARLAIELRFNDVYIPLDTDPYTTDPVAVPLQGADVVLDLVNVDDPTGTYEPPFDYPVTPAPRTQGPDGRAEGGLTIDLPQE